MLVSYCTTCKGRLWQLKQVMFENLCRLDKLDAEWIILDYHCPDQLFENLMKNNLFDRLHSEGKVKLYRLNAEFPFSMPLAKNLAHSFSGGDIVFNLDADNYIGNSFGQLSTLKRDEFLWVSLSRDNGTCGRIGTHRQSFFDLGGYDLELEGAGYEDLDFVQRLVKTGHGRVKERGIITPVQNTRADTLALLDPGLQQVDIYQLNRAKSNEQIAAGKRKVNLNGLALYKGIDLTEFVVRL